MTRDEDSTFGCRGQYQDQAIDISDGYRSLKDNSEWHPTLHEDDTDADSDLPEQAILPPSNFDMEQTSGEETRFLSSSVDPDRNNGTYFMSNSPREQRYTRTKDETRLDALIASRIRDTLPFNVLQTTEVDIHLLHNIQIQADGSPTYGHVISQLPVHQDMDMPSLSVKERLNMVHQIPEIGIILVGNQQGRVAVLTATKWISKEQPGFRVECVLPTRSQEKAGMRPKKALLGFAVGPIQGHENQPEPGSVQSIEREGRFATQQVQRSSRRFRLMMMYHDFTVLNYQIFRATNDDLLVI